MAHLCRKADGRYVVAVDLDKRYVKVEDAPYRALGIEVTGSAEGSERELVRLDDGSVERFDPATFWIGQDGTPYCLVRDRTHKVRFTAESYRQLSAFITEDADAGGFLLQIGSHRIPVSAPEL